jgi:outer membrane receptor protein involved in Fe transport
VSNLHLSTDVLAKGLALSLNIGNLFDKRYAQPGADSRWQRSIAQDRRTVRAQASFSF